jgi:GntR family transcriptional regulator
VAIAAGELAPGAALPSVRRLAQQLRVNPATVVQAYRALASDGFVDMRQGAGTFVREVPTDRRGAERLDQARRVVRHMLAEAARLGIHSDEIMEAIKREMGTRAA